MNLSWLSTALALAVTVSAGALRDVSPFNQPAVRRGEVNTITTTDVVEYFHATVLTFDKCTGQLRSVTDVDVAVELITKTYTKINTVDTFDNCQCQDVASNPTFTESFVAVFVKFQAMVTYVQTRFPDSTSVFDSCWAQYKLYFAAIIRFATKIGVDFAIFASVQLDVQLFGNIGINLDVLGLHLGLSIGGGGGGNGGIGLSIGG